MLAVLPLALLATWVVPTVSGPPISVEKKRPRAAERRPTAPRPMIISRAEWGADDSLRTEPVTYTGAPQAAFVHHTGHPDDYDCADVPAMLRAMQVDHVLGQGWDDLGYNFVVDKCGTIYEGRAGGIDRFVLGAHTTGFNHDSVGIAALGDFSYVETLPEPLLASIASIAAWKLSSESDPLGQVRLVSTNDASRYAEGTAAVVDVIAGHRDIFYTHCPGDPLYAALPDIRDRVVALRAEAAAAADRSGDSPASAEGAEPDRTTQPDDPTESAESYGSAEPAEPEGSDQTAGPVDPDDPAGPARPDDPAQPARLSTGVP
ncbi:N-acetylmuramoyl-L-alanine amidase [Streptomyces sp. B6B3]|uniref:N-acetylmuramoyl-L-alanine amidase n=1 Tax=Streptomyces sp. B6B3 TaxID=3153570 RepID=UPI00325C6363